MIHYELFFLYNAGFRAKDVIRDFGYSRGTAYRFYRIYRLARIRAKEIISSGYCVSPERENKSNTLDHLVDEIMSLGLKELSRVKGNITRRQNELRAR